MPMNKFLTFIFILLVRECKAATGNASDGPLLVIVVMGLMLLILGTGYFIDFSRSKLKEFRNRRKIKKSNIDQDGELFNPFDKAIHELDSISSDYPLTSAGLN